jgi:hypothetical protein
VSQQQPARPQQRVYGGAGVDAASGLVETVLSDGPQALIDGQARLRLDPLPRVAHKRYIEAPVAHILQPREARLKERRESRWARARVFGQK